MVTFRIDSQVHLGPMPEIPGAILNEIKASLTFPNPAHQEAERPGFSTWNIPQEIQGYQVEGGALVTPRGFSRQLVGILKNAGVQYYLDDQRRLLAPVDFTFHGELRMAAQARTTVYGG